MKKVLLAFAVSLVASSSYAANWLDLGKSSDNTLQIFLDLDTVKPYTKRVPLQSGSNNYISAFIQMTYINNNELRDQGWYYAKEFTIIDCANETYITPSSITYGFKNQVVATHQDKYFTANDFRMAFPETVANEIVHSTCRAHKVMSGYNNL